MSTAVRQPLADLPIGYIKLSRFFLPFILLIGLFLRLYGFNFGLPYIYGFGELAAVQSGYHIHRAGFGTDEPQIVRASMRILANRSLNPEYFDYPGTPLIYMGAALYAGMFVTGLVTGQYNGAEDFIAQFTHDPTVFYIVGRLLVIGLSLMNVLLLYFIGRRIFSRTVGLIGALFLTLSPMDVALSQLFRVDVLMVTFILIAFWFCLGIMEKQKWSAYLLAGLFTGFAAMTKYPGIIFSLVIFLAHLASRPKMRDHLKLVAAAVATLVGAFISSPYVFLDFQSVLTSLSDEAAPHLGGPGEGLILNLVWYFREAFPLAISVIGLLLVAVGFYLCLRSRDRDKLLFLTFPVIYLVFISLLNPRWERWILPPLPFACLLLAYALVTIKDWLARRHQPGIGVGAALGLGFLICLPLVQLDYLHGHVMLGDDTRTIARQWMIDHIPAGSRVLMELNTPQTPVDRYQYYEVENGAVVLMDMDAQPYENILPPGRAGWLVDIDQIHQQGIEYLVLSDYYERYLDERAAYPDEVATYEKLLSLGAIIYEVAPTPGTNEGPRIRIIKL